MDWKQIKQYYIFGLALLVSAFLIWFGSKFLFTSGSTWDSTQLFAAGVILILAGVFTVSSPSLGNAWMIGGILMAAGFFMFARAAGVIEFPWLAKSIGVASWGAAFLIGYITFPRNRKGRT